MRNYFAIAFTFVYLILTVGVAKTTHYCMGRLNTSSLYTFDDAKCACAAFAASIKASKSCCKDEHELITLDNDQSQTAIATISIPVFFVIQTLFVAVDRQDVLQLHQPRIFTSSSPPVQPPLFKLHCSLLFYS
jgi:hypothetical protein